MRLPVVLLLAAAAATAQLNTLTPKEASEGWILLYDGKTTFGWTPEGKAEWTVGSDGSLVGNSADSGWLRSNSAFADYILKAEFKTGPTGNSGIFLRSAKTGAPHETGYELQIWNQHPKFATGSLVNHIAAKKVAPAADRWHAFEIQAIGDHFIIKLDGKKILDGHDKKSAAGHIGLQYNKNNKIEFRNLKLKPLSTKPLFDGKSLSGWQEVQPTRPPQVPAVWKVEKGMIHVVHGGGQLETTGAYADYILQLDVRTNAQDPKRHPNSGVFNRGEAKGYWTGYEVQIRNEYKDNDRTQPVDWGTGAIYGRSATRNVLTNDNEFFTMTINVRGTHFGVWLNGYPVTDWEDTRPEGATARQGAKTAAGAISLQAHDPTTDLNFRNIRLEELPK